MKMKYIYAILFVAAVAAVAISSGKGAQAQSKSKQMAVDLMVNHLLEAKEPQETRPLVDPDTYRIPYISETYKIAAENREALDKQFCYCYCALNEKFKHKSLLTCFTDGHGANCGICMRQARETAQMTKAGKTPREIAMYFKETYDKPHDHNH